MLVIQMIRMTPLQMILWGGALLVLGVLLPLLMVLKILPSTFLLGFLSYSISVVGMFLGLIGAFSYVKEKRR